MGQRNDGTLEVYIGKSRCGKTSLIYQRIADAPRVLAWDTQGQFAMYPGWEVVRSLHALADALEKSSEDSTPQRIAYQPQSMKDFDLFCRMAYAWIVQGAGVVFVEELADVTTSGKACDGWGILTRRGLKYGPNILAAIQRPQWCDKDTIDNATTLVIFQNGDKAAPYLIDQIGVPAERVPKQPYTYNVRTHDGWKGPLQTVAMPDPGKGASPSG